MSSFEADPQRYFGGADGRREDDRKLKQLCRQVERAAASAVADCADEALADAYVCGVSPAPDARRLAVAVSVADASQLDRVHEALGRAAPLVRARIASEIHRKRVPEIAFELRLAGEVDRG